MKRILRSTGALLLCSALFTPVAHAYLTVVGNGTAPATFVTAPVNASFYKPTGEYYFGLVNDGTATGTYAVCYGNYRTADTAPTLTALANDTAGALYQKYIDKLAVVPYSTDITSPTIVAVPVAAAANSGTATTAYALTKTYQTAGVNTAVTSGTIGDYAAAATGGVRAMATSRGTTNSATAGDDMVFFAVVANGLGNLTGFGAFPNGDFAPSNTAGAINAALITRNATTGAPVFNLGANGTAFSNTATTVDFSKSGSFICVPTATDIIVDIEVNDGVNPAFWYDEILGTLYVGGKITYTPGTAGANGLCSVGVYTVTKGTTGVTISTALRPFGVATNMMAPVATSATANSIVAIKSAAGSNMYAAAYKLRTMHTSTGLPYLIVNGAVDLTVNATGGTNQIFALPLVTTAGAAGTVGCFANVNKADHSTLATAALDLTTATSAAALIGQGPLSTAIVNATNITDMYVDGDAVYVAVGTTAASNLTEPGLFKSQAIFNDFGQIANWTAWQKVMPGEMGGNTTASTGADSRIDFAAVDGYTGHIWVTNKTSLASNVSQWTAPSASLLTTQSGLAAAVNAALPNGLCYSVLDLNTATSGWGATSSTQVTAFGGQGTVCFAITGSSSLKALGDSTANPRISLSGSYTSINTQLTTGNLAYDYTNTQTFHSIALPTGAGAVIALGFSGWNGTNQGFLLAGCAGTATTAPALYALTADGTAGLQVQTFGYLNATALTNAAWVKISNVAGMPVKIASLGGGCHVLTRTASLDRVYSCAAVATAALLNTSFVVTASSGNVPTAGSTNSSLASVQQIYDLVVSVSATPAVPATGYEQLMIMTNDGVYTTSSLTGMQNPVDQLQAGWVLIAAPTTNGLLADYFGQPNYNRFPQTFWYGNWAVNATAAGVYNRYIWQQMSRQDVRNTSTTNNIASAIAYAADPNVTATYNGATSFNQTSAPTIYATFPVNYRLLYDDGCRRFFVQKNPGNDGLYQVLVLPYNLYDYNITTNGKATMSDAVVAQAGTIYWMGTAGDTGRLLMSTSNGIVSLQ